MKETKEIYDAVIIGGGPAGLTAAIYLARAKYRVVVVEKERFGGQITITSEVVNFPGVARTSGEALTETMRKQGQSFGAEYLLADVSALNMEGDIKIVKTSRGELRCFGVLLATGAHPRSVGFKGEEEFKGRGVAYCATCDGEFFTGKDVFVVGGGFAAAEESVFLTKYAHHVTILMTTEDFTCAPSVCEPARNHEKITVLNNVDVQEVSGDDKLKRLTYRNSKTGEVTEYNAPEGDTFGVFVFAGYEPATELIKDLAKCDEFGYVITDKSQKTSCDGLYAAGDVCIKPLRQVVTAVGDGALAATEMERYASAMQKKTGLHPVRPETAPQPKADTQNEAASGGGLFTGEMVAQLGSVFQKMTSPLTLKLYLDDTPIAGELKDYITELCSLTDKLSFDMSEEELEDRPCVRVCRADGSWTGLAFHGVPGGHEFTSFVLGLYNASGPGQALDEELLEKARRLHPVAMKIFVSLSCTMCPELVTAAQKIAAENASVTAEVYDLNHFPALRDQYNVMSVPCLVVNEGEKVMFGKKNVPQLVELL